LQQAATSTRSGATGHIEVFEYPEGPACSFQPEWSGLTGDGESMDWAAESRKCDAASGAAEERLRTAFEERLSEERRRVFEAAREQGRQEGRASEREATAAALAGAERERVRKAAELACDFARERDQYLQAVEREVVELSLAVAARILRREAQMDPLLLTGAVRVALGQLASSTKVRLMVPAGELDLWNEAIRALPGLAQRPEVVAGEGMRLGDCVIETEMGSIDLGVRAQLGEIERGFFDRATGSGTVAAQPAGLSRESESGA